MSCLMFFLSHSQFGEGFLILTSTLIFVFNVVFYHAYIDKLFTQAGSKVAAHDSCTDSFGILSFFSSVFRDQSRSYSKKKK